MDRRLALGGCEASILLLLPLIGSVACAGGKPSGDDLLILRDRTSHTGALAGCTANDCSLNDDKFARARIEWIGLHGATTPPTAERDVTDRVFFNDGRSQSGRLLEIDADRVVTPGTAYPRRDVRWVHLGLSTAGATTSSAPPASVENWTGVIDSTTSRAYKSDFKPGSPTARVCRADWHAQFTFRVEAAGKVSGSGRTVVTSSGGCEISYSILPQMQSSDLTVTGTATSEAFTLLLAMGAAGATGAQGADYGAYTTLFLTVPYCQSFNPRQIIVPRSSADTAISDIDIDQKLTCAGSGDDDLRARHVLKLTRAR